MPILITGVAGFIGSALATHLLAKGKNIRVAVDDAKKFISRAIVAGAEYSLGQGCGPVKWTS